MSRTPRIAVVGSANVDVTTFAAVFPRPGETIFGEHADVGFGGKGANQAVAARLCGGEVAFVARLGDDLFGAATLAHYRSLGIDVSYVLSTPGAPSGTAAIFVEPGGQNRIIVIPGANALLRPEDIDAAAPMLRDAGVILAQIETPLDTVRHLLRRAREWGVRTILNPAPATADLDPETIGLADILVPNEIEAEALSGEADPREAVAALLQTGIRHVILTLGERGALLDRDPIAPFPVEARDTTGAGDAFIGSFAAFLCEGFTEHEAARRASLYAALSVTVVGAQKSFPKRDTFDDAWRSSLGIR